MAISSKPRLSRYCTSRRHHAYLRPIMYNLPNSHSSFTGCHQGPAISTVSFARHPMPGDEMLDGVVQRGLYLSAHQALSRLLSPFPSGRSIVGIREVVRRTGSVPPRLQEVARRGRHPNHHRYQAVPTGNFERTMAAAHHDQRRSQSAPP